MKTVNRLLLAACLAVPLAACQKDEAPQQVERAAVPAPTGSSSAEWRAYLQDLVPRHMDGIVNTPYIYLVPAAEADEAPVVEPAEGGEAAEGMEATAPTLADDGGAYQRQLDKARSDLARGIVRGNLLAYAGADPARVAGFVEAAFEGVPEGSMQGVRVLYIGSAAESPRAEAAVAPAGVEYVFVDTQ
ncbi:hypothetical protein [Luteimonas abyssi]|jgi:hypothetical protein|uniref:hypothetical protein n=1 Tax=Luteimonas abyssi TaxID=1247514 RepID=UPI000737ACA8|nr:hypothetical protein [Luteimonas abyssi]